MAIAASHGRSCLTLFGLTLLFGKRAGTFSFIGIALLMVGQFIFGDRQIEQRVT